MKVVCDRAALLEAVNLASGVVAARSPKPQLGCVKLSATSADSGGELSLSATDAEVALTLRLGTVDVQAQGQTLVPADKLRQIVSAEDNDPTLTIEGGEEMTHIRGADAHFQLHGFPPAEFPAPPNFQEISTGAKAVFQAPAGSLEALVGRSLFAAARETTRYAINGVLVKREAKKLEVVATDGRRLALCTTNVPGSAAEAPASCIVPSKALGLLLKLIADPDEPVQVAIADTRVVFGFGDDPADLRAVLASSLVEGSFPPYEDVIPKDQDIKATFDRDVLASGVKRAALLTNEESRGVRLAFNGAGKTLELSSRAPEMGEAKVTVELAGYDGSDIEIGFNPQFITDALKVVSDPEISLELKASNKPGLMRSGQDFVYVVMPVNLA